MTTITRPSFIRQTGIFNPAENEHASVTFVGCGGIGSFAAFATAKLGIPNITLVDPDRVEEHNIPSQMYDVHNVDDLKVNALAWQLSNLGVPNLTPHPEYLCDMPMPRGVVVSGLDSMAARIELWENKLKLNPNVDLYIDGRLDGQLLVFYALRPWDLEAIEKYEQTLASDDEVPAGVCTERNIIDVGFMVGSLVARMIRLHLTDQPVDPITVVNQASLQITKGEWF